jgi:hypothetical protein
MKNNIGKFSLLICSIWLLTGLVLSFINQKNLFIDFYLGLGVLVTLNTLRKVNYKIN